MTTIQNNCGDHCWLIDEVRVVRKKERAEALLNGQVLLCRMGDHKETMVSYLNLPKCL